MNTLDQNLDMASAMKNTRISVSFPPDVYLTLERIAKEKKVSVAWVIRDATDNYLNNQWPLFSQSNNNTKD